VSFAVEMFMFGVQRRLGVGDVERNVNMAIKKSFRPDQYKLITFDSEKDKDVYCGDVVKGVFYRHVFPEHYMRVFGGYGIQEVAFQEIQSSGITKVVIVKTDTNESLKSEVDTWLEHGKVADYGHGKQRFLSVKYMNGPVWKSLQ